MLKKFLRSASFAVTVMHADSLERNGVVFTQNFSHGSAETTGRVRLDGVDWNARCATPGDTLAPGQSCRVAEIHSTLLIVEPVLTETARRAAH